MKIEINTNQSPVDILGLAEEDALWFRDELALAVLIEDTASFRTPRDLGDTRKELLAFVKEATEIILRGSVIQGIASEVATNPALSQAYREQIIDVRLAEVGEIINRGIERGDLRADTDVRVAHELLIGPLMYRLIFSKRPLNKRHANQVVDAMMTAFAAGG